MKKIGLLIVLIFAINFVSAIDIELEKSSYNSMETLEAIITGGFIDNLVLDNIGIYANGAVHKSPVISNVVQYEDKYYYYAIVPETSGTYSLRIENTKHYVGTHESTETVEKNFTITESNSSYLGYDPGFIYTSNDFYIDVTAYSGDQDVTVDFPEAGFKQTLHIVQGKDKSRRFYISIANITNITQSQIKIGSYSIPAIIIRQSSPPKNNSGLNLIDLEDILRFNPKEINATMLANSENTYELYLDTDDETIEDLKISSSNENIIVSPESFSEFSGKKVIKVTIIGREDFEGFINLSIENSSILIPVTIQITKNTKDIDSSTPPVNQQQTCAEMSGDICLEGESCPTITRTDSSNNLCCLAECTKSSSSGKWVWGILIIIILGAGGWFLYNKSKESQDINKTTNSIMAKRAEDYKKRMESAPKEVKSGLSKD